MELMIPGTAAWKRRQDRDEQRAEIRAAAWAAFDRAGCSEFELVEDADVVTIPTRVVRHEGGYFAIGGDCA